MPTKRKQTKATERAGINYVRTIVENHNCIFQEIDLGNDVGNDAYIEFIQGENATSCCIAVQIKSGASYINPGKDGYVLKADKNHFEYWHSHILPIGAIVFNPLDNTAAWCDITAYLDDNPDSIQSGPYSIHISSDQRFDKDSFDDFLRHFLSYQQRYRKEENFAKALEGFADIENIQTCLDGIRSLFSYHRQRPASWYYLISCFANYRERTILETLTWILTHLPGHGDILWHKGNIIDEHTREKALAFLISRFG